MANTITKTTLIDSHRNLVVHVSILGDGSGDETVASLIDRSAFSTDGTETVIKKVCGHLAGFSGRVIFDATADLDVCNMPDGDYFCFDWDCCGGISSNKAGAGSVGDVILATSGLGNGERGTFTIFARKS